MHISTQLNCWSLRCSWSIACRRCSNYIFILDLTHGLNGLSKDNCKTRQKSVLYFGVTYIRDFTLYKTHKYAKGRPYNHNKTKHNVYWLHHIPCHGCHEPDSKDREYCNIISLVPGRCDNNSKSVISEYMYINTCTNGSGHGTVAVLLPGFAINW